MKKGEVRFIMALLKQEAKARVMYQGDVKRAKPERNLMILSQKLLAAIQNKVRIWQFHDIYSDRFDAVKAGAGLLINNKGIRIKRTREMSYIVQFWNT